MNIVSIQAAQSARRLAEARVQLAIDEFVKETGLFVTACDLTIVAVQQMTDAFEQKRVAGVTLRVSL